jgi:hypothetical protein
MPARPPGGDSGVWFLAGAGSTDPTTRSCTVPADVALFTPIITSACWFDPPSTPRSRILGCAIYNGGRYSDISATLDGVAIPARDLFRVESSKLFVHVDPRGIASGLDNVSEAAVGVFLFLRPLAAGPHVLHFSGTGTTASTPSARTSRTT